MDFFSLKGPLINRLKKILKDDFNGLMQVKSIAECYKGALSVLKINFWPSFEWLLKTGFTVVLPEWVKAVGQKLSGDLWRPSCHGKILVSQTASMEHCGWFDM